MFGVMSIASVAALALVVGAPDGPGAASALKSPFPRADIIAAAPVAASSASKCPTAPPSVRNIVAPSKFGDNRRQHDSTVLDPEAEADYAQSTREVVEFSRRVASLADAFAADRVKGARNARCALAWLNTWAEQEALLGKVNSTGQSVRKWELATLASAYLKIRNAPLDAAQSARVRRWLGRVAKEVRKDYSDKLELDSRSNNHLNWAAWAVMAAAVAVDDRALFNWSIDRFRFALRQVQNDGTLPLELKRRQLAAAYHNYALAPLIMLREGAAANGVTLSRDEEQRLQRLVDLVIVTLDNPGVIAGRSGYPQDMSKVSSTHLAWLEPYHARTGDPRAAALVEDRRPLTFSRLGGNLTALFGENVPNVAATATATGAGKADERRAP